MIHLAIMFMTLAIWSVIGFIFWLPFLSRAIAVFSSSILYYAATRRDASHLRDYLDSAINFYSRGFALIKATFNPARSAESSSNSEKPDTNRIVVELFTTALFWGSIWLLFKH